MGFFSWWTRGHKTKTTRPIYNIHLLKNLKKEGKDISGYCQKVWMHVPSLDGKTSTSHLGKKKTLVLYFSSRFWNINKIKN